MALEDMQLFSPYASVFDSLVIPDTIDTDLNPQVNSIEATAAGSLDRDAQGVANLDPRVGLNCLNLGHLATISATLGLRVNGTSKIQYQARGTGGGFAGAGDVTIVASKGHLCPESISAQQDQAEAAQFALMFYPLWNGTDFDDDDNAAPLQYVEQALQGSPAIAAMYKLGPCTIGDELLGGLVSARVQFGLNYQTRRQAGEDAAREGAIYKRSPQFAIEPRNVLVLDQVRLRQVNSVAVVQYFRKIGVAGATAEHISISGTGALKVGNVAARNDDDPKPGLVFMPTGVLTVSTTATIPTP